MYHPSDSFCSRVWESKRETRVSFIHTCKHTQLSSTGLFFQLHHGNLSKDSFSSLNNEDDFWNLSVTVLFWGHWSLQVEKQIYLQQSSFTFFYIVLLRYRKKMCKIPEQWYNLSEHTNDVVYAWCLEQYVNMCCILSSQ